MYAIYQYCTHVTYTSFNLCYVQLQHAFPTLPAHSPPRNVQLQKINDLRVGYVFGRRECGQIGVIECQFILRIRMINAARLPPLPKGKTPSSHSLLHLLKITNTKPSPAYQLHTSHLSAHSTSLNEILHDPTPRPKQRPLSSKSGASSQGREGSSSVEGRSAASRGRSRERPYLHMPEVTAKSWILYEMREGRCLYGKRNFKKREVASLTKIMNLITILEILQLLKLNAKNTKVRVSQRACSINGTSAELKQGAVYSLEDLFYGMMLPSGNDAAIMIAEVGGYLLKAVKEGEEREIKREEKRGEQGLVNIAEGGSGVGIFLRQMNRLAKQIGMFNTKFANPHGLSNTSSHSTATDLAKLCSYAMRNQTFRKIVHKQKHTYSYTLLHNKDNRQSKIGKFQANSRKFQQNNNFKQDQKENINPNLMVRNCQQYHGIWQNTNRMLGEGWSGIKTGVTPNAGPCLAASFSKMIGGRQLQFLVVLLNSQSMQARWEEVRAIVNWAIDTKLYL